MTREEAITVLKDWDGYFIGHSSDDVNGALNMAIKALEQTRWIPVSERLPEKYTHTLWCASSGYVRSDYFNGEFWEDAKKYCYEVIAWMPLPEPYMAESEAQDADKCTYEETGCGSCKMQLNCQKQSQESEDKE